MEGWRKILHGSRDRLAEEENRPFNRLGSLILSVHKK